MLNNRTPCYIILVCCACSEHEHLRGRAHADYEVRPELDGQTEGKNEEEKNGQEAWLPKWHGTQSN